MNFFANMRCSLIFCHSSQLVTGKLIAKEKYDVKVKKIAAFDKEYFFIYNKANLSNYKRRFTC